jgi:hypothetical protein
MSYWIVDGQQMTNEEHDEWEKQKELKKQRAQEEAARLGRQLNLAYAALKDHMERNPKVSYEITGERALEQQIYYNLRQNLHRADDAPRCAWTREDGTVCKSPRMRNDIYCYAHCQMRQARAENLWLPALTDANAIQMAVMLVQRALIDDEITEKKAGLLLYSIQIAAANVHKTTFGRSDAEMVTEKPPEEAARREQMEARKRIEKIKALPLINTEDTDLRTGEQSLPRINTDDRGSEEQTSPRINTDQTDQIGEQNLPLIHTEDTDLKSGEKTSPRMNTDQTDQAGVGKMLPDSVSELYADRGQSAEVHANLG